MSKLVKNLLLLVLSFAGLASMAFNRNNNATLIPIRFYLKEPGYVTLVIEDLNGVRVRNLISDTWYVAGSNTAWWDGLDDLGRDADAANHGLYHIPAHFVMPGKYIARGLVHKEITPRYQYSVYSGGNPPWNINDHTGAWLSDHSAPKAALFVPATESPTGKPAIFLGCNYAEGCDGLVWVDLDGRKLGGKIWVGGNWLSAPFMARDAGDTATPEINAFVGTIFGLGPERNLNELVITALTKGKEKPVLKYLLDSLPIKPEGATELGGLAAYNNIIIASLKLRDKLLLIDAKQGKILSSISVKSPRGVAFDAAGKLLVLSDDKLLKYSQILPIAANPECVITSGLDDPFGITFDNNARIYISDKGNSNQVKVFDNKGIFLNAIGKPGQAIAGPYDSLHMNNPAGITIDSKNQLWVAEQDFSPKRVSVWTLDGKLIKAFYGPAKYGGGGTIDPSDKSRFYYSEGDGAMEFKLNWQNGTAELKNVYYRPQSNDLKLAFSSSPPTTALYRNKQRYFTNCYNTNPTNGHSTAFLFIDRGGIIYPVAAAGNANLWDALKSPAVRSRWPDGLYPAGQSRPDNAFFIWCDKNADGQVQPDEVTIRKGTIGGVTIMPDLSICIAKIDDKTMEFSPTGFNEQGIPDYNIDAGKCLASGVLTAVSDGGNQALEGTNGWTVVTLGIKPFDRFSISGAKNGVPMWSYPDMWPGLHPSHNSPVPQQSGELVGTTRLLGGLFNVKKSDAGPFFAINGNEGNIYLFTQDGLFVSTLFKDKRLGKSWRMPKAIRGMKLDSLTLGEENFWPTITQMPDSTIYMVDGNRNAIVSFDGMDGIRRLPITTINVTKSNLIDCRKYTIQLEAERQQTITIDTLTININHSAPVVDGKLNDWTDAQWVTINKMGVKGYFDSQSKPYNIKGAIKVAAGNLYIAYQTNIQKLNNTGEVPLSPFLTGDALDLMISTNPSAKFDRQTPVEGDSRLLITLIKNKPVAFLYKAKTTGVKTENKTPFSSPLRTITFDEIDDVSSQIQFAANAGSYEISIPLIALGLNPKPGMLLKGDIGVLQGQQGITISNSYWNNKAESSTSDVPSQAELLPALWGIFKFM